MIGSDPAPAQRGQSGEGWRQQSLWCYCDTNGGRINVCVVIGCCCCWMDGSGGARGAIQQGSSWKMSSEEVSWVICSSLTIRLMRRWTPPPPHLHLSFANYNLVHRESHVGDQICRNRDSKKGLFPRWEENVYWYMLYVCSKDWHGIKHLRVMGLEKD